MIWNSPVRIGFLVQRTQPTVHAIRMTALLPGLTAACSASPPRRGPVPGTNVACLLTTTHRNGEDFDRALQVCGVTKPDLTGNIGL